MSSHLTVISFFTAGPYEQEAARLRDSLDHFAIVHHIRQLDAAGSWVRNCALKPAFIFDCLQTIPGPLLWLDADAEVKKPLTLFNHLSPSIADVAVYRRTKGRELLSGTIWFSGSDNSKRFVHHWLMTQTRQPERWDQKTLDEALRTFKPPTDTTFTPYPLPPSACYIFDSPKWGDPVIAEPTVLHHQASRRLKMNVV